MSIGSGEANQLQRALAQSVREHWVLFLIEGIVLLVLGLLAIIIPPLATLWVTIVLGCLFLVSGVMGLITTWPLTAIGRSSILCIPRMALCGILMIGVLINDPNTPPLVMVNVPPCISSIEILRSRVLMASSLNSLEICTRSFLSASRSTGTIKP